MAALTRRDRLAHREGFINTSGRSVRFETVDSHPMPPFGDGSGRAYIGPLVARQTEFLQSIKEA